MTRLEEFRSDIRTMGIAGWAFYLADRVLDRISRGRARLWVFRFYAQAVPLRPMLPAGRNTRLRVGPLAEGSIDPALFGRPLGAIEERFRAGSVCIAALDEGQLAGFMWLHFGRLRERLLECDFEALPSGRTCWDYDLEVTPRYRLGRTFARLWDEANRLLRDRGVAASVSWVTFWNLASQHAHERMGARRLGWVGVVELFGLKLAVCSEKPLVQCALPRHRLYIPIDVSTFLANAESHSIARNHTPEPDRG